ncbi:MAG: DNA adenine methylase [Puniceicoccales bacterium]|jgi:DNA adenine methylase|nr:DNA adenine methylase [Puniceicoccales bacterium]
MVYFELESAPQPAAKPFVKWVGGKKQLLPEIQAALPASFADGTGWTYIEPFVGGGAVLFWMLRNFPNLHHAIINDINPDLINTYRIVRNAATDLIGELKALAVHYRNLQNEERRKEFYLQQRDKFNDKKSGKVESAAMFIFLNRTCFNGLYRVNSKGGFNVPFGKYTDPLICDEKTILADNQLLQKVEILNGDFATMNKDAPEKTLFYLDPPYKPLSQTSSFNSYAKEGFGDADQIRLKEFCDQLAAKRNRFILSNADLKGKDPANLFFDELYANYDIRRVWASRMVNANPEKRGKLSELLITNQNTTR